MNVGKRRMTPAFVVAMIALFVALGGTAGAVAVQTVPLAKRALTADNAKKLAGQTPAQLTAKAAQTPGPASTAAGLLTIKNQSGQLAVDGAQSFNIACDSGQKVMGGGFSSSQLVAGFDSYPSSDTTWSLFLANLDDTPASVTVYATCLR